MKRTAAPFWRLKGARGRGHHRKSCCPCRKVSFASSLSARQNSRRARTALAGPFASSVGCGRAEPEWASLNLVKETVGIDSIEVSLWQTLRRRGPAWTPHSTRGCRAVAGKGREVGGAARPPDRRQVWEPRDGAKEGGLADRGGRPLGSSHRRARLERAGAARRAVAPPRLLPPRSPAPSNCSSRRPPLETPATSWHAMDSAHPAHTSEYACLPPSQPPPAYRAAGRVSGLDLAGD